MKVKYLIAVFIIILASCATNAEFAGEMDGRAETPYYYYSLGEESWDSPERAIEYFTMALEIDPDFSLAYWSRGHRYFKLGMEDKGWKDIETAFKVDPSYTRAAVWLADRTRDYGDPESALKILNVALEYRPGSVEALQSRAWSYMYLDMKDEALKDLELALEISPDFIKPEVRKSLGHLLKDIGRFEEAEEQFLLAAQERPEDAGIQIALGQFYKERGKLAQAEEAMTKAVDMQQDNPWTRFERGRFYLEIGNPDAALADFELVVGEKADPYFYFSYAEALFYSGFNREALEIANRALELTDGNKYERLIRGYVLLSLNDADAAFEDFELSLKEWDGFPDALVGRGEVYFAQGSISRAISDFTLAAKNGEPRHEAVFELMTLLIDGDTINSSTLSELSSGLTGFDRMFFEAFLRRNQDKF
jgi:tetratricopeptide (TPR) repeat protein